MSETQSLRDWLMRDRGQIALVFTDIVGSTRLANRMGDNDWIEALKEHFARARSYKETHGGYEVKLIGDACMIAFHTAWPAVQFALDFSADTGHPSIKIKAGVHSGQIRVVENDMYGAMVNYTARVVKAASGMIDINVLICESTLHQVRAELGAKTRQELHIASFAHKALEEFPANQQQLYRVARRARPPAPISPELARIIRGFSK